MKEVAKCEVKCREAKQNELYYIFFTSYSFLVPSQV